MEEQGGGTDPENKQTSLVGGSGCANCSQEVVVVHESANDERVSNGRGEDGGV